jgi:uncharacterized protein YdeI (YjbR/CyaY-like superfamily)
LAFVFYGPFYLVFASQPRSRFLRQKNHTDAVFSGRWEFDASDSHFVPEELVRNLNQDARAISGQWIRTDCTAVGEIPEDLQTLLDDRVATDTLDVRDKTNAASVVFIRWIVETLLHG